MSHIEHEEGTVSGLAGKSILKTLDTVNDVQDLIEIIQTHLNRIVLSDTTEHWNSQPSLMSIKDTIYVYTDYRVISGENVPDIKIGDGTTPVIDLPFIDKALIAHVNDTISHTSQAEKTFWNNKVRCYSDDVNEKLIFTTN